MLRILEEVADSDDDEDIESCSYLTSNSTGQPSTSAITPTNSTQSPASTTQSSNSSTQ